MSIPRAPFSIDFFMSRILKYLYLPSTSIGGNNMTKGKQIKHIDLNTRHQIKQFLMYGYTAKQMSETLGISAVAISKEVFRNRTIKYNDEHLFLQVDKTKCPLLDRFPFTCHSCSKKRRCLSDQYEYDPIRANKKAESNRRNAKPMTTLSKRDLETLREIVLKGLSKGQSINHIVSSITNINVSTRTVYRLIENGALDIPKYKLRRATTYRLRKKAAPKVDNEANIQIKNYVDYLREVKRKGVKFTVQMDCVEGIKTDNKVILTFFITEIRFFYAVVLKKHDNRHVVSAIDYIEELLGLDDFMKVFGTLLTDRGHEFKNSTAIEFNRDGIKRCNVYYCDPMQSTQKGGIESIHRLLRYVFPKGKTLEHATQSKLLKVINMINSYVVRSCGNQCSYDVTKEILGQSFLDKLKVTKIDPDKVFLTPYLVV